jgi:uncharacterized protein with PhoU and TrkA domain
MKHKVGDVVCIVKYVKIKQIKNSVLGVEDVDSGEEFNIIGESLINKLTSADSSDSTQKASKTELAQILSESWCIPFTVTFTKTNGEERVLRGRLIEPNNLLGRSLVEDLDKNTEDRLCQVDHRTISSIVVGGIHYSLK